MTCIRAHWQKVSSAELAWLLCPRDDLVKEQSAGLADECIDEYPATCDGATNADLVKEQSVGHTGEWSFGLAEGPFLSYGRTVSAVACADKSWQVTEETNYRLAVPYFAPLVNVFVRRELRKSRELRKRKELRKSRASAPSGPTATSVPAPQPLWAPPQRFDPRAASVFATVAAALLLAGFLSNAPAELHTYAADEFGSSHLSQGVLGALVRVGSLLAIGAAVLADRQGRKRVLGIALVLGIAGSVAASLVPNLAALTVALTVTRTATATLAAVALVIVVEEVPPGCRAWSLAVLAMTGALGAGMVVWLQPIAGFWTWGWRLIFLVPLLAVPLVPGVLRRLPETTRFENRTLGVALRGHAGTIALLGAVFFGLGLFLGPLDWFRNEFLRDEHGFSAWQVTLFLLTTATPGAIGLYTAGRLSESIGRKLVVVAATTVGLGAAVLMFNVSGVVMWCGGLTAATVSSGLLPALGVYRGELFPTAVRVRASTIAGAAGVLGGSLGVLTAGWLRSVWGSFGPVMAVLWVGPLVVGAVVVLWFREGGGKQLEQLNPVDALGE